MSCCCDDVHWLQSYSVGLLQLQREVLKHRLQTSSVLNVDLHLHLRCQIFTTNSFRSSIASHTAAMAFSRALARSSRTFLVSSRPFMSSAFRPADINERANDTAEEHRKIQKERPLNPHMTNTNSTITNEMPSLGKDKPPPEMISSVDPNYVPKDAVAENTERMTGGTQKPPTDENADLDVGEIEGGSFKVEPIRRTGEEDSTMRSRLLCPFLTPPFPLAQSSTVTMLTLLSQQTRVARGEPSKVTSFSPPSPTPTSAP